MKNILKSIVVFLAFIVNVNLDAQTIIPIIDDRNQLDEKIENILSDRNFTFKRNSENFKNINLSGLSTDNADYSEINKVIEILNSEGWDVKIISRYNLEKFSGNNATEDYLSNILTQKQIIIDVFHTLDLETTFTANVRSSEYSSEVLGAFEKIITTHLASNVKSYEINNFLKELSKALSYLYKSNIDNLTLSDSGNNRSFEFGSNLPRVLVPKTGYFLSNAGIPILIPEGAIVSFWKETSYHPLDKAGTNKFSKGMIAYIEVNGKAYLSRGKLVNGNIVNFYQTNEGDVYKQPHTATKKIGEKINVNIGVVGSNCTSLSLYEIAIEVTHVPLGGADILLGNIFVDVEKDIKFINYKQNLLGADGTIRFSEIAVTSPRNLNVDCPPILSSADVLNALNQSDFYCKIDKDPNDKYIVTFNNGDSYLLFYESSKTWFSLGKNTNSWMVVSVSDNQHETTIDNFIKRRIKEVKIYDVGKTIFFFVVGVATGVATGGLSTMAILAADVGLAAVEAGIIYYVEKDATSAVITLVTGGLASGVGIMAGRALSKGADDVLKNTTEEVLPATTAVSVKTARAAAQTVANTADAVIKIEGGYVKMSVVRDYAKNVLKYTDEQIQYLSDDLIELSGKGKQSWLLKCTGIANLERERLDDVRNTIPCLLKARSILAEAATTKSGKSAVKKIWITASDDIYDLIIAEGKHHDDAFLKKLRDYYKTHQMPGKRSSNPPFTYNGVDFDKYGHPRFEKDVPAMKDLPYPGKIAFKPSDPAINGDALDGSGTDIARANQWAERTFGNKIEILPSGRCKILNDKDEWVECVWHHHEDGRNLIPVPYQIHNRAEVAGVPHTGGASVIDNGIEDFFPALKW